MCVVYACTWCYLPISVHTARVGSMCAYLPSGPTQHHPMITPIWATPSPITSPAVSKMGSSFHQQSLPIPSSLLSSMQHFVADASTSTHTTLPSLYAQLGRLHQQPRRMPSDNQIHSSAEDVRRHKNGLLLHHASAPSFPYINDPPQEVPCAPAMSGVRSEKSNEGRLIAVPSPHALKMEEAANEHRIEYIDQYQQGKLATPSGTRSSHCKRGREGDRVVDGNGDARRHGSGYRGSDAVPPPVKKQMVETEFDKARLKFIAEAREWSQSIGKKVEESRRDVSPSEKEDVGGERGRGGEGGGSGVCREEQERMLQKHFANLVHHHTPAKVPHPRGTPPPAPAHSAMSSSTVPPGGRSLATVSSSGGAVSTAANAEGAKLPPVSLPSLFLAPTSMGMLPYLTSNAGLQSAGAMLCSPALLNSYAALQMMSSGGKPVLLSDLHSLHNLQNFFALQNSERLLGIAPEVPPSQSGQATTGQSAKQSAPQLTKGENPSPPQTAQDSVRQNHQPHDSGKLPSIHKRRRSNSLPGGLVQLTCPDRREAIKEVDPTPSPRKNEVSVESPPPPPPPPPPLPPPLIQLPKELRQMYDPLLSYTTPSQQQVNDPMLSYTTPSRGSPLGVVQFGFVPNNSFHVPHTTPTSHELVLGGGGSGEEEDVQVVADLRDTGVGASLSDNSLPPCKHYFCCVYFSYVCGTYAISLCRVCICVYAVSLCCVCVCMCVWYIRQCALWCGCV